MTAAAEFHAAGLDRLAQGDAASAEQALRKAVELAPDLPEYHKSLGNALRMLGRPDEASVAYTRALQLDPAYLPAYNNLGLVQFEQGAFAEAEANLRKALELDPTDSQVMTNLGVAIFLQGRTDEAIALHRRALAIEESDPLAWGNLGSALKARPDGLEEAVTCFERALMLNPDFTQARSALDECRALIDKARRSRYKQF